MFKKADNANNFISIRNAFGKDARFTKEDLIEYGMQEGYVNQFINSMVRENMLKVAGRFITFNNMYLDDYLKRIDSYISVGELITRFREDKISPEDIKKSMEYKIGSNRQEPFYQFYKIVNREIRKKFEKDLLTTEDIWRSIDYTTISNKELERWYNIQLGNYQRGMINESFVVFNELLIQDYLKLKGEGILEAEIRKTLNVSDKVYEFWCEFDRDFEKRIKEIKMDLLLQAIQDGKTKDEIIEYAGVTLKEYNDLVKVSDFNHDEFSRLRGEEIESRKKNFVKYLKSNDLKSSCRLAKITLDDFYTYYDSDENSQFHIRTTEILMDKYLAQRRLGRKKTEAMEIVQIPEKYLNRWLSRTKYSEFKDRDLKVTVDLILKGFRSGKSAESIAQTAGVSVKAIKSYVKLGERGSEIYRPLFEYYENEIMPKRLMAFIESCKTKSIRKSLQSSGLEEDEFEKYYMAGKSGDHRFADFYDEALNFKKGHYIHYIKKQKSHKIAMKESCLTGEEYEESKDDLERTLRQIKINIVIEAIENNKTSNVAARKAGCSVDEIYDWYFKGRDGDEEYKKFYEIFHHRYVRASAVPLQEKLDNENAKLDVLIKSNRDKFTKKDVDIWLKNGIIHTGVIHLDEEKDDDEDESDDDVKEISLNVKKVSRTNSRSSLGGIQNNDYDVEDLKRQILKK